MHSNGPIQKETTMLKKLFYVAATASSVAVIVQMILEIRSMDGYDKGWKDGYDYGGDRCFDGGDRELPWMKPV